MADAVSCPSCGHVFSLPSVEQSAFEAQSRIEDLQTQVRLLNSKAAAAVDKLADYEDEIRSLRAQYAKLQKERETNISVAPLSPKDRSAAPLLLPPQESATDSNGNRQSLSRLSSFGSLWSGRKRGSLPENSVPAVPSLNVGLGLHVAGNQSTPNLTTSVQEYLKNPSPPPFATDPGQKSQSLTLVGLQTTLETEREMRLRAESSLTQAQSELEELTAQLFGQANEMVATERKARAKLEERVKLLETRDGEKRRRLERLEKAVERIERVRRMVVEHETTLEREKENLADASGMRQGKSEKVVRSTSTAYAR